MAQNMTINVVYADDNEESFKNHKIMIENEMSKLSIKINFSLAVNFEKAIEIIKSGNGNKGFHAVVVDKILHEEISEYMHMSPLILLHARKVESACQLFFISGHPTEGSPVAGHLAKIFEYWSAFIPHNTVQCQKGAEFVQKFVSIMKQPQMSTISRPSR